MPFKNFIALRNAGTLIEEELSTKAPTKIGCNYKSNYKNKDKKFNSSKEVYVTHHFTECTPRGTTDSQASIVSTTDHGGMTSKTIKPLKIG